MATTNNNYYSLPYHSDAGEILADKGYTWMDDQVDDNRDIDSFIINGFEKTFSLYDSKNFDLERERLQNRMNEKIIPVTIKEIELWSI